MSKFATAPNEAAFADGELQPVSQGNADKDALVGDSSFSEMVGKMRREFDDLSVPLCEEIIDWQKSQGWLNTERTGTDSVFGIISGADETLIEAIKKRDEYWQNFFNGVFHELHKRAQNQSRVGQVLRTIEIMALAIGFTDVADAKTPAELAYRYGKSRETINKPLHEILLKLQLPPLATQRNEDAVKNITDGRNRNKKVKNKL